MQRLSPDEMIQALGLLQDGVAFEELTGMPLTYQSIRQLQHLLINHLQQRSWFSRMADLMTFYNIVRACAAAAFGVFVISFTKDIIIWMLAHCANFIIAILENGYIVKCGGLLVSVAIMAYRTEILFGDYNAFLGFFLYIAVTSYIAGDITTSQNGLKIALPYLLNLWIVTAIVNTLYREDWLFGVVSVLILYIRCGFYTKSITGGYVLGFNGTRDLINCAILSVFLVCGFISCQLWYPEIYGWISVFETGAIFWGSFVGLLCLLIMSDRHYVKHVMEADDLVFMWMQIVMFTVCLICMYFGTMMHFGCEAERNTSCSGSLRNLGGTFMMFWALDFQHRLAKDLSWTPFMFGVSVNLYALQYLIRTFPEYFILI